MTLILHQHPCPRCEHAKTHDWFGPPTSKAHCNRCHRDWPRRNEEAHCDGSCRHFKSTRAFDLHQKRGHCVDPATLKTKDGRAVLTARATPDGLIWVRHDHRTPPSAAGSCTASPSEVPRQQPANPTHLDASGAEAGDARTREAA